VAGRGSSPHDRELDIRPADPDAPVATLSTGTEQKVLLGKWLASSPKVLVLHEPTQAVDVGARRDHRCDP
jgi:ribose transport system ATP-binding protein